MKERRQKKGSLQNGFIVALLCSVALAFLFPSPGAREGWMHPDLLNNAGIALILFLQGLAMAVERMKSGAANWRLHLIIQSFTFLLFPVVGLAFHEITRVIWPSEPSALRDGFLYLCVLPSTVSTSVVLTSVARGNTSGAIFNAALSNILGVLFTPLLVRLLMQTIMFYHPFQLFICGLLADYFSAQNPAISVGAVSPSGSSESCG